MIGSLLYVTASRTYVIHAIGQVARFQTAPTETHILAVKTSFKYLKGTIEFGIWYPKVNEITLIAYSEVDWEGFFDDRRSTNETTFFLGNF